MPAVTVTGTVAVLPDSDSVTVIVVLPLATPVTSPADETVATAVLAEVYETVESDTNTVAPELLRAAKPSEEVLPTATLTELGLTDRLLMVESIVNETAVSSFAVMVTVLLPLACAVPNPSEFGKAWALSVSVSAGRSLNVTVEVLPDEGRLTVWLLTTLELLRKLMVMAFDATGMSRVSVGQVIERVAEPTRSVDVLDEPPPPPPQPTSDMVAKHARDAIGNRKFATLRIQVFLHRQIALSGI